MRNNFAESFGEDVSTTATHHGGFTALIAVLLLTIVALYVAGPGGNFPTNDDGLYADGVRSLVDTGVFSIINSVAYDFIPIMCGAAICKSFGFSYETLRLTTMSFHLLGICGIYFALRELQTKSIDAALISTVYALNPFTINLSLSFMTDIPALAFTNWSLFLTIAAIRRKQFRFWLLAILFLTASMSVRQSALVFMPSIVICGMLVLKDNRDRYLFAGTLLIPALAYICLQKWLLDASTVPVLYGTYAGGIQDSLLSLFSSPFRIVKTAVQGACYLGLFLMPVTVTLAVRCVLCIEDRKRSIMIALLVALGFVVVPLIYLQIRGAYMPYSQNLFAPPVIGCYNLIGGKHLLSSNYLKILSYLADFAAALVSFSVVFYLIQPVGSPQLDKRSKAKENIEHVFFATILFCTAAFLLIQFQVNNLDRYYVIALGPMLIILTPLWNHFEPKKLRILTIILTALMGLYSTLAAADFMNFSRAQWLAIIKLESSGVSPREIDGGANYTLQVGGQCLYAACKAQRGGTFGWPENTRGCNERSVLRWWPILRDDYIIAAETVQGYHIISQVAYWSPIYWMHRSIFTLKSNLLKHEAPRKATAASLNRRQASN
jgi:4-amino-4-deoxy-L-arabinose transferase-like glycosyltransferase